MSLSTGDTKDNLSFSQSEADTIMLSVYAALRSSGYSDPVVIDTEDTDVYIQAAAISHHIPGILCIKKRQYFFCRSMCTEDFANCLIPFHVLITGVFLGTTRGHFMRNCQKVLRLIASFQNVGKDLC